MRPDDIVRELKRQPFQPFRVCLSDGTVHEVRHPELAVVGRSSMFIGRPAAGEPQPIFDEGLWVALLHINRIEALPVAANPSTN